MRQKARPTTKADETPEFVAFWSVWRPHMNPNDGRGDARDEFFKHVEMGADPDDIVDGARWFIHSGGNQRIASDGKPVQSHASTWLNKRAYEDGCEQWRSYQARLAERENNVVAIGVPRPTTGKTAFLQQWNKDKASSGGTQA